jgi:hypothetical protein
LGTGLRQERGLLFISGIAVFEMDMAEKC